MGVPIFANTSGCTYVGPGINSFVISIINPELPACEATKKPESQDDFPVYA
ncbi:MAG TPA: hypothetical protein PLU53_05960 [Bacteroidia bacterium]|nr:hypothetical protein [Bacteroidia bacterium]